MNKYLVKINGKSIEVEVEMLEGEPIVTGIAQTTPGMIQRVQQEAPDAAAPVATPAAAPAAGASDTAKVTAPMPGNVLDVLVKEGDSVTKGQVLLIFEAMKMENEVQAVQDGVVAKVLVEKNAAIQAGDVLIEMQA